MIDYREPELQALYIEVTKFFDSDLRFSAAAVKKLTDLSSQAKQPQWHVRALLVHCDILDCLNDSEECQSLAERALQLSRQNSMHAQETAALFALGVANLKKQELRLAQEYLSSALTQANARKFKRQSAALHNSLGILFAQALDTNRAIQHFRASQSLYAALNSEPGVQLTNVNMATLAAESQDFNGAVTQLTGTFDKNSQANKPGGSRSTVTTVGNYILLRGEYTNTAESIEKANNLTATNTDSPKLPTISDCAYARLAWAYAKSNKRVKSNECLGLLRHLPTITGNQNPFSGIRLLIAETYEALGQLSEARHLLQQITEDSGLHIHQHTVERAHASLARIYAAEGDHQRAFKHQQELANLGESHRFKVAQNVMQFAVAQAQTPAQGDHNEQDVDTLSLQQSSELEATHSDQILQKLALSQERSNKVIQSIHNELEKELPQSRGRARSLAGDTMKRIRQALLNQEDMEYLDDFLASKHHTLLQSLEKRSSKLTRTERRVCVLISLNLRSKEIADCMCVSPETVKSHRKHIRAKLSLSPGANLSTFLIQLGGADNN